jgi:hypothetical protein
LADKCNICSSSALSDILVLCKEVLAYNTPATSYSCIFTAYKLKVFALSFLRKSNATIALEVHNAAVKFKVIDNAKLLLFLS